MVDLANIIATRSRAQNTLVLLNLKLFAKSFPCTFITNLKIYRQIYKFANLNLSSMFSLTYQFFSFILACPRHIKLRIFVLSVWCHSVKTQVRAYLWKILTWRQVTSFCSISRIRNCLGQQISSPSDLLIPCLKSERNSHFSAWKQNWYENTYILRLCTRTCQILT